VLAGMLGGPVVWIRLQHRRQEDGLPYPYGLAALGLDPHRLVLVEPDRAADGFWALEEALRSGCAGAVLAEGLHPDLTQQRRLQLAAERGSAPALLVNVGRPAKASAASTQWNVASVPGTAAAGLAAGPLQPMPAAPRWSATLQRCRGARTPQSWIIERQPGTGLVEIVPVLPVRQPQPPQPAATAASLAPAGLLRRTG
jgi:protein ImuA